MQLYVTVPPSEEAISLNDAKLHLRVDGDDDDTEIEGFIAAARERAEQELQRPLLTQTCESRGEAFPCGRLRLWKDVKSVTSVTYVDETGAAVTLPPSAYRLVSRSHLVPTDNWPRGTDVVVVFDCGAFEAGAVPQSIIAWMKLQIGSLYENRESVTTVQRFNVPDRLTDGLLDRWRDPEL
ncbi:head-tail connector protein [Paraburkholderia azotifigens]|uniref:head-tail connector protein n=1 Tax=Paraburkholderia azotifigens TaxID=2057004 RepID=UPI003176471B